MPITWRNVGVDGAVGEGIRNYNQAAKGLSQGLETIGDTALKYDQAVVDAQTNEALAQVAGYQNAGQLSDDRGNIMQNLGRADASKVAAALNKRESAILANDGTRITNEAGKTELQYLEPKLQQEAAGRIIDVAHTQAQIGDIGFQQGLQTKQYNFDVNKQQTEDNKWQAEYDQRKQEYDGNMLYNYQSLDETKRAHRANESIQRGGLALRKKAFEADKKARADAANKAAAMAGQSKEDAVYIANTLSAIDGEQSYAAATQGLISRFGVKGAMPIIKQWLNAHKELKNSGLTDKNNSTDFVSSTANYFGLKTGDLKAKDKIQLGTANRILRNKYSNGIAVEGVNGKLQLENQQQKDYVKSLAIDKGYIKSAAWHNWGSENIVVDEDSLKDFKLSVQEASTLRAMRKRKK